MGVERDLYELMADNGLWFKLWCSADDDPDLDNLDISDFGRYCKLGIHIKAHGTSGTIYLKPPQRALCAKFQVANFEALVEAIRRFPHVDVTASGSPQTPLQATSEEPQTRHLKSPQITSEEGSRELPQITSSVASEATSNGTGGETGWCVVFRNWARYQGDISTNRVRRFREKHATDETNAVVTGDVSHETDETAQKRREREEKRRDIGAYTHGFVSFWGLYPRRVGKDDAYSAWKKRECEKIADGIIAALKSQVGYLMRDGVQYVPHPSTWINQGRWKDEVPAVKPEPKQPAFRALNITK